MEVNERVAVALENISVALDRIAQEVEGQSVQLQKVVDDLEFIVDRDGVARKARTLKALEKLLPNLVASFFSGYASKRP